MMSEKAFENWLLLAAKVTENLDSTEKLKCPRCGHKDIDYLYIGNFKSKVGYLQVWCNYCNHGIHISRVLIPEGAKALSFESDIEVINSIVPNYIKVHP